MVFGFGPLEIGGAVGGLLFSGGAAKKRELIYKKIILPLYRRGESLCCQVDYQALLIRDAEENYEESKLVATKAGEAVSTARALKEEIEAAANGQTTTWVSWIINSCRPGVTSDMSLPLANAATTLIKAIKIENEAITSRNKREKTWRDLKDGKELVLSVPGGNSDSPLTTINEENTPPALHAPMSRDPSSRRRSTMFVDSEEEEEKESEIDALELSHIEMAVIGEGLFSAKSKIHQSKEELNRFKNQAQETLLAVVKWQERVQDHLKEVNHRLKEFYDAQNKPGNTAEHITQLSKAIKIEKLRVNFQEVKANMLKNKAEQAEKTAQDTKEAIDALLMQFEQSNEVNEEAMVQIRELSILSIEADKLAKTAASELRQFIIAEYIKSSSSHHKIQEFFVKKAVIMIQEEFAENEDVKVVSILNSLAFVMKNREDLNVVKSLRAVLANHFATTEAGRVQGEIRKSIMNIDKVNAVLELTDSEGNHISLQKALTEKAMLEMKFTKAIAAHPNNAVINIAAIIEQITAALKEKNPIKYQEDLQKAKALLVGISDSQLYIEITNKAVLIDGIMGQLKAQSSIKDCFAELVMIRNIKVIQDLTNELSEIGAVNKAAVNKLEEIKQNVAAGNDVKKYMQLFLEMKQGHSLIVKAQALITKFEQHTEAELIVSALKLIQRGIRAGKPISESIIEYNLITSQLKNAADKKDMVRRESVAQESKEAEEEDYNTDYPVLNAARDAIIGFIPGGKYFFGNNDAVVRYQIDAVYDNPDLVNSIFLDALNGKGKGFAHTYVLEDIIGDKTLVTDEDFAIAIMAIDLSEALGTNYVVEENNVQDVIDKFKEIVGEEVYQGASGFNQYIAKSSYHVVIAKLVESLDAFSQMKGVFETALNVAIHSEEYQGLVEAISRAITILTIGMNDRLDTIAQGVVLAPKYSHFGPGGNPGDDSSGGTGGGGGLFYEGKGNDQDAFLSKDDIAALFSNITYPHSDDQGNVVTLALGDLTYANSYYERDSFTLVIGNITDDNSM